MSPAVTGYRAPSGELLSMSSSVGDGSAPEVARLGIWSNSAEALVVKVSAILESSRRVTVSDGGASAHVAMTVVLSRISPSFRCAFFPCRLPVRLSGNGACKSSQEVAELAEGGSETVFCAALCASANYNHLTPAQAAQSHRLLITYGREKMSGRIPAGQLAKPSTTLLREGQTFLHPAAGITGSNSRSHAGLPETPPRNTAGGCG